MDDANQAAPTQKLTLAQIRMIDNLPAEVNYNNKAKPGFYVTLQALIEKGIVRAELSEEPGMRSVFKLSLT